MNIIARKEFELAYYDSTVQHFNHYAMRTRHPRLVFDIPIISQQRDAVHISFIRETHLVPSVFSSFSKLTEALYITLSKRHSVSQGQSFLIWQLQSWLLLLLRILALLTVMILCIFLEQKYLTFRELQLNNFLRSSTWNVRQEGDCHISFDAGIKKKFKLNNFSGSFRFAPIIFGIIRVLQ